MDLCFKCSPCARSCLISKHLNHRPSVQVSTTLQKGERQPSSLELAVWGRGSCDNQQFMHTTVRQSYPNKQGTLTPPGGVEEDPTQEEMPELSLEGETGASGEQRKKGHCGRRGKHADKVRRARDTELLWEGHGRVHQRRGPPTGEGTWPLHYL